MVKTNQRFSIETATIPSSGSNSLLTTRPGKHKDKEQTRRQRGTYPCGLFVGTLHKFNFAHTHMHIHTDYMQFARVFMTLHSHSSFPHLPTEFNRSTADLQRHAELGDLSN